MWSHLHRKTGICVLTLLLLAGCESTIDKKEVASTPTVTVPVITPTITAPPITVEPKPTPSPQPPPTSAPPAETSPPQPTPPPPSIPEEAAPSTIAEFLQMVELDQSFAPYVHQITGENGVPVIGYHIATNGQVLPEHRVPPGVVLDYSPDGLFQGAQRQGPIEWIDENCGLVIRIQAGSQGGSFSGTIVTYYWSGWAGPPAAPEWCS